MLLLSGGCNKAATAVAPAPSTQEQDALWALAPEGATFGVVTSAGGVDLFERAALSIQKMMATAPELAGVNKKVVAEITKAFHTQTPTLAAIGIGHDHGFAAFAVGSHLVVAIPVVDRDKFLAIVEGKRGADVDVIKDTQCKTIGGRYICTDKPELLGKLGGGKLAAGLTAAGARGEIELVYAGAAPEPSVALAAQLSPGAFVVRAAIGQLPPQVTKMIGAPSQPPAGAVTAAGFGVIDLSPFLAQLPPDQFAPGITLADVGKSIAGPLTMVLPGGRTDLDLGIRVPLSDSRPMQALIGLCAQIPFPPPFTAKLAGGGCHVEMQQVSLDVWVDGKELRIGSRTPGPQIALSPTPLASELAQGQWSVASYGRGSLLQPVPVPQLKDLIKDMPADAQLALRIAALVSEAGIGIRRDGDTLHVLFGMRTAWANPDEVVGKLLTAPVARALTDASIGESIAAAAPDSPFAGDLKAGPMGLVASVGPVAAIAAIGIPAFMDYMKKSKKTEASLQLNKIGKNAKRVYAETSAFPVGHVALTPSAPCCKGPNAHCPVDAAGWQASAWKELDFEINEPSLYQYSYDSDGKTFTAKAVGDLDCDGAPATYELHGSIDAGGNPKVQLIEPAPGSI